MGVNILQPGSVKRCPPGQATLTWTVSGCAPTEVLVEVVELGAWDAPAPAARPTGHVGLRLTALPRAVALVVRPAHGTVLPDGVVVTAELTVHVNGVDTDHFVLPPADVSAVAQAVLLELAPRQEAWQLVVPHELEDWTTAARPGQGPLIPEQGRSVVARPDLVRRATYAARRQTGVLRWPAEQQVELRLAIDRSASFLPYVRTGAAQTLFEVLVGLNAVIGRRSETEVWQLGPTPRRTPVALGPDNVEAYVDVHLSRPTLAVATPLEPLVTGVQGTPRTRTVVITDAVPADLVDVEASLRLAASQGGGWQMLVLGRGHDDPVVRQDPWRDELGALRPLSVEGLLTSTSVTPAKGPEWLRERLADADELDQLVGSIVEGST